MTSGVYIGIEGKARKIKNGYIGYDDIARRIKKAYIGIGGVARPCWGGNGVVYYGAISELSSPITFLAATTVGDYALFGGGCNAGEKTVSSIVNVYNSSLTKSNATQLYPGRCGLAATTVGDYALFGGGATTYSESYSIGTPSSAVNAYDRSLTRSTPANLTVARQLLAATTVGDYALFGGGYNKSDVNAYDKSLTATTLSPLGYAMKDSSATTVGNYALFGGGSSREVSITAYNGSLTKQTPTAFKYAATNMAATTVGDYALFAGGEYYSGGATGGVYKRKYVYAYDKSLTQSMAPNLDSAVCELAATTIKNYAIFAGGVSTSYENSKYIATSRATIYDHSLTKVKSLNLSVARSEFVATTVGNYALFGGGMIEYDVSEICSSTMDAFTVL